MEWMRLIPLTQVTKQDLQIYPTAQITIASNSLCYYLGAFLRDIFAFALWSIADKMVSFIGDSLRLGWLKSPYFFNPIQTLQQFIGSFIDLLSSKVGGVIWLAGYSPLITIIIIFHQGLVWSFGFCYYFITCCFT